MEGNRYPINSELLGRAGTKKIETARVLFHVFQWVAGAGLLLLRATVGVTAVIHRWACLTDRDGLTILPVVIGLVAIAAGASLLAGFATPFVASVVGVGAVGIAFSLLPASNQFGSAPPALFVTIVAVAVALLGPGAGLG